MGEEDRANRTAGESLASNPGKSGGGKMMATENVDDNDEGIDMVGMAVGILL